MTATEELLVVFVSRFSPSCQKIAGALQFLGPHVNLKVVDIDNPRTREAVVDSNKIQTVPALALLNVRQQRVEFYEGEDLVNLINKAVNAVQQKVMAEQAEIERQKKMSGTTDLQKVMSGPAPAPEADPEDATRATLQDRSTAPVGVKRGEGHENMRSSLPAASAQAPQGKKKVTFAAIDEDYAMADEPDEPRGLTREEILGPQGASIGQEQAKKASAISQKAKELMQGRDEI